MIYATISLILSVVAYSISQLAQHGKMTNIHYRKKIATFWGRYSDLRKYKYCDPDNGPAFFGSTTFLVFLTDGYHLMQFCSFLFLSLSFYFLTSDWHYGAGAWAIIHTVHYLTYKLLSR